MQVIGIEHFGESPHVMDLAVPEPGPGQVRVAIEAAAINPLDTAIASGALADLGRYRFPLTLGVDGAGTVTALGPGVSQFKVGDRVLGQFWDQPLQFGTFAEVCVVHESPAFGALARIPEGLPSHVAAALPTAGMTALGAIEKLRIPEAGTLLVIGATGGVGTFALQAAAAQGIRVVATASAQLADSLRALGAAHLVTRGAGPLDQSIREVAPDGFNAVLDLVGDAAMTHDLAAAVRDGGTLVSTAFGLDDALLADRRIHAVNYQLDRRPERLAELTALVTSGTIQPVIGQEIPFEQAERALVDGGAQRAGRYGKVILRMR